MAYKLKIVPAQVHVDVLRKGLVPRRVVGDDQLEGVGLQRKTCDYIEPIYITLQLSQLFNVTLSQAFIYVVYLNHCSKYTHNQNVESCKP